MAYTAHKDERMMEEIVQSPEELDRAAAETARLIKAAKQVVFFTGAGISTASGIPDYRGPEGCWTLAAQGKQRTARTTPMTSAVPTSTHMAMVQLFRSGLAHHVISQNVDGMHRKSGIPYDCLTELHGNTNDEECNKCGKKYIRDYTTAAHYAGHFTGRDCVAEGCEGKLIDTIINFGENLSEHALRTGFSVSEKKGTLHICLGSSLTVRPAKDMPIASKEGEGGRLVICNLQRTPLDDMADVRAHGRIDDFMTRVMKHLGLEIPPFTLNRRVTLWRQLDGSVFAQGTLHSMPQTLFSKITFNGAEAVKKDPFQSAKVDDTEEVNAHCTFLGHHEEPDVTLTLKADQRAATFDLSWNLTDSQWTVTALQNPEIPSYSKGLLGCSRQEKTPQQPRREQKINTTGWFAVSPKAHCPHCPEVTLKEGVIFDMDAKCMECGNVGENMICLTCWEVHCGRHVNEHMLVHHVDKSHPMVAGFVDLSFWCYPCESYIDPQNKHVNLIYELMVRAKFPEDFAEFNEPTSVEAASAIAAPPPVAAEDDEASSTQQSQPIPTVGFEVDTIPDCMHCKQVVPAKLVDPNAACRDCGNVGENMMCLTCHHVFCGRHVKAHMLAHHEQSGHPMVMGLADLSIWCYLCEKYVDERNPALRHTYTLAHVAKFNEKPPGL